MTNQSINEAGFALTRAVNVNAAEPPGQLQRFSVYVRPDGSVRVYPPDDPHGVPLSPAIAAAARGYLLGIQRGEIR